MNDAMFSGGVDGGHANGKVRAATVASSSASTESVVATWTASVEVPLREVLARLLVQQDDVGDRIAVGVPIHFTADDRSLGRIHDHVVQRVGCVGCPGLVGVGERRHAVEAEVGRHDERIRHPDSTDRHVGALDRAAGKAFDRDAAARVAESRRRVARLHAADGDVCDVGAGIHPQRVTDVADRRVAGPRAGSDRSGDARSGDEEGGQDDQPAVHLCLLGSLLGPSHDYTRGVAKGRGWTTWSAVLSSARADALAAGE